MVCPECQTTIPDVSRFCLACGAALTAPADPARPRLPDHSRPSPMLFNSIGRYYLHHLRGGLGDERFRQACARAALPEWASQLPSANLMRKFPFSHLAALQGATRELLGDAHAHAIHVQCGQAILQDIVLEFGPLAPPSRALLRLFPPLVRTTWLLQIVADTFDRYSDQASRCDRKDQRIVYTITQCAECWGYTRGIRGCSLMEGLLGAAAQWIAPEQAWRVTEVSCHGRGDPACTFWVERGAGV